MGYMCFCSRSKIRGEEDSTASPGDDQCGLSAYHDGQQQRRYIYTLLLSAAVFTLNRISPNFNPCNCFFLINLPPGFHAPRLVTIENCMKLTQMIVQGLQESKSPLLQLPHFEEEHLRYCISKKVTWESVTHTNIEWNGEFLVVQDGSVSLVLSPVQSSEPAGPGESQGLGQTQHAAFLGGGEV